MQIEVAEYKEQYNWLDVPDNTVVTIDCNAAANSGNTRKEVIEKLTEAFGLSFGSCAGYGASEEKYNTVLERGLVIKAVTENNAAGYPFWAEDGNTICLRASRVVEREVIEIAERGFFDLIIDAYDK
jgi:hypothetical protein